MKWFIDNILMLIGAVLLVIAWFVLAICLVWCYAIFISAVCPILILGMGIKTIVDFIKR